MGDTMSKLEPVAFYADGDPNEIYGVDLFHGEPCLVTGHTRTDGWEYLNSVSPWAVEIAKTMAVEAALAGDKAGSWAVKIREVR